MASLILTLARTHCSHHDVGAESHAIGHQTRPFRTIDIVPTPISTSQPRYDLWKFKRSAALSTSIGDRSPIRSKTDQISSPASSRMVGPPATEKAEQGSSVISEERVVIPNKYGEKLVGVLHDTGSRKIVVLCHGFRSSKEDKTMRNLAAALTSHGISAFRFDFAGNGESEGLFEYGNYRREADDLHAVFLDLSGRNREVGAIVGHSKGGDVVLLYASIYHDVHMVVNLSGRFTLEKGIIERIGEEYMDRIKKDGYINVNNKAGEFEYRVTEDSLKERLNTDMRAACLSIDKECRVLTVHGSEDEIIPVEDAFEISKCIPNHKLHIIEGANHCYTAHQAELAAVVVDFITSSQV